MVACCCSHPLLLWFPMLVRQNYLNSGVNLPPSNTFNGKLRGYPDVAFNGHHYSIFISQSGDQCPCQQIAVDGTSCSSPAFAGLVSLLDDFVISNGGSPLGFLNPLLYKMASEQPNTFNDITSGDNKCNRQWCCEWGYELRALFSKPLP